jgi:hypothetical protein
MLDAVRVNPIIVGAYSDRGGGVCPMLAAHRNGGRTSFASFARAWDRYTRAGGTPRRATEREVRTLTAMLEVSIALGEARGGELLAKAIAEHRESQSRNARRAPEAARQPSAGERYRAPELARRRGWAWLRPSRRLDEYERALAEIAESGGEANELEPALTR